MPIHPLPNPKSFVSSSSNLLVPSASLVLITVRKEVVNDQPQNGEEEDEQNPEELV